MYNLELNLDLNEFNPDYPRNPQNLGQQIRKARMDKGLLMRELAEIIGVTPDTIINWEVRGLRPAKRYLPRVRDFIDA